MRWNPGDADLDEVPSLVKIQGGDVVGPYVQAQAVVASFRRPGFGPTEQCCTDATTTMCVADGQAVQEHATPVVKLQHRPDVVVALGAKQHIIVFLQHIGRKNIRGGDDFTVVAERCNAAIAVRDGIVFAADAARQQVDRRYKRDQIVEQEFIKTAAGDAHEPCDIAAVVGAGHAIGDLNRHFPSETSTRLISSDFPASLEA